MRTVRRYDFSRDRSLRRDEKDLVNGTSFERWFPYNTNLLRVNKDDIFFSVGNSVLRAKYALGVGYTTLLRIRC